MIAIALAVWAVFYLPDTPSYAIFELKQSIDARDGAGAARYVDFQKVVRNGLVSPEEVTFKPPPNVDVIGTPRK